MKEGAPGAFEASPRKKKMALGAIGLSAIGASGLESEAREIQYEPTSHEEFAFSTKDHEAFKEHFQGLKSLLMLSGLQKEIVEDVEIATDGIPEHIKEGALQNIFTKSVEKVLAHYDALEHTLVGEYEEAKDSGTKRAIRLKLANLQHWRVALVREARDAAVYKGKTPELPPKIQEAIAEDETAFSEKFKDVRNFISTRSLGDDDLSAAMEKGYIDGERQMMIASEVIGGYEETLLARSEILIRHFDETTSDEYRLVLEKDLARLAHEHTVAEEMREKIGDADGGAEIYKPEESNMTLKRLHELEGEADSENAPEVRRAENYLAAQLAKNMEGARKAVEYATDVLGEEVYVPEEGLKGVPRRKTIFEAEQLLAEAAVLHQKLEKMLVYFVADLEKQRGQDEINRDPMMLKEHTEYIRKIVSALDQLQHHTSVPIASVLGLTSYPGGISEDISALFRKPGIRQLLNGEIEI